MRNVYAKTILLLMTAAIYVWAVDDDAADTLAIISTVPTIVDKDVGENDNAVDEEAVEEIVEEVVDLDEFIDIDDIADFDLRLAGIAVDTATPSAPAPESLARTVRREYSYANKTRLAIVMMVFLAAAMSTSQSWNPR